MKKEVGKVITACRKYHSFTQEYMACKLGVTVNTYANLEHGRVDISTSKLHLLAQLLRMRAHQILALAEEIHETKEHESLPLAIKYITA